MDKIDYQSRCENHLSNENVYKKIGNNPTKSFKTKINNTLKQIHEKHELSYNQYRDLYSSTASTPRFYGLIKTHKEGLPISPIVSFIDSPSYKLA